MATGWMRKNRRIVLAVLVVILMVAWGALPALRYLVQKGSRTYGTIRGEAVGAVQMRRASQELNRLRQAQLLQPGQGIGGFIFQGKEGGAGGTDAAWRYMVLVREARYADIEVMPGEYRRLFAPNGPLPADDARLREGVINLIKISKLMAFQRDTTYVSTAEKWMDYNYEKYEVNLDIVQIEPSIFVSLVEVASDQVQEFYEQNKDVLPDPQSGTIGYKAPRRVKIEYAFASEEECKKQVSVSEDEIKEYYENHKSEYKIQADEEQGGNGDSSDESADEKEPDKEKTGEKEGENGEKKNEVEKEPRYKPLSEVRKQIKKKITTQKAEKLAEEKIENVLNDLDATSNQFLNEPHPIEQMARRYDCQYAVAATEDGREYLSREEIEQQMPGGTKVASRVFDEAIEINYYSFLETPDGSMVIQILDRRKAQPEPFSAVEGEVKKDFRREKALEKARAFATELQTQAEETSLSAAVKSFDERLVNLLGQPPENEEEQKEKNNEDEAEAEEAEKEPKGYLQLRNTGYIPRTQRVVQAVGARCPEVLKKATLMEDGEIDTVTERGQETTAVYVFEKKGGRNPAGAGFWPWKQQQRLMTMFTAPRKQTQQWLDGLLEKSPLPTTEK